MIEPDLELMRQVISLAEKNAKGSHGGPFAAAVVDSDGKLVAMAANEVTRLHDATAHGEIQAIRKTSEILKTHHLKGHYLYTSCYPCPMCLGAIMWSRLEGFFYAANKQQAADAHFDDQNFHEAINDPAKLHLEFRQICADEAMKPFNSWLNNKKRENY